MLFCLLPPASCSCGLLLPSAFDFPPRFGIEGSAFQFHQSRVWPMKQLLILVALGLALSLCNLSSRFGGGGGGTSDQRGTPSGDSTETVEQANPTAAQTEAIA